MADMIAELRAGLAAVNARLDGRGGGTVRSWPALRAVYKDGRRVSGRRHMSRRVFGRRVLLPALVLWAALFAVLLLRLAW